MQKNIQLSLVLVAITSSLYANSTVELEPITVTSATKTTQSIQDVTSNVNVITSEEIEEKRYTTVTEALNSISGISFTSNGGLGNSTSLRLRGFDSKRILILIDGIRYNDVTSASGAPFEHLMINDIQQIEVIKGAQSGIWGADATAGVVNIITKSAKKGLHGFVNSEYGSFDTLKYGGGASYKTDDYYIKASSQKVDTNGFTSKAPKGTDIDQYEKDGYRNITSNIKLGFNFNETNKVNISHTIINAHAEYDSGDANSFATSRINDSFSNINFNHIDSFNELDIYVKHSKFDRNYPQGFTKEYDGEVYEYGVKSNIPYNEKDFVIVGAEYKSFEHKNDLREKYNNKSIFATNSNSLNCPLGGKIILTESLRADRYSEFENKTTGKIGVKRVFNEDLFVSLNYGTAYNVPTPTERYGSYANPSKDLQPDTTKSFDISVGYKDLKVTYFHNKIKNMIDFDKGIFKYNNLDGTSTIKGLELEYSANVSEDVFLSTSYTYLSAKDTNGEDLERRPKETFKFSADYYGITDLHLGIFGEYIGDRVEYSYGTYNINAKTGNYTLVNMVANYEISKNLSVYAKIDNLLDKHYQVVDGYAIAPRSAYLGFKADF